MTEATKTHTGLRTALGAALTVLVSTLATLTLVEGLLRIVPRAGRWRPPPPDYGETVRGGGLGPGGLLKEGFEGRLTDGLGGTIFWKNNAAGFRRREETAGVPAPGVLRILSMGDSFTAGYRVDQEATFSRLVELGLRKDGIPAEVLIAEIEEPTTGLWWLLHGGFDWHPSRVVLGVTLGNDVAQTFFSVDPPGDYRIGIQGGHVSMEPLDHPTSIPDRPEYSLRLPTSSLEPGAPEALTPVRRPLRLLDLFLGPAPQPVFCLRGASFPHALFDGTNGLGIFLASPPPEIEAALAKTEQILRAYAVAARENGVGFLVVLFPQRFQVQDEDWRATVKGYGLNAAAFDLDGPNRRLSAFCAANSIDCLDLADPLRDARKRGGRSLYLPGGDMHWSAEGHRAASAAILPAVARALSRAKP